MLFRVIRQDKEEVMVPGDYASLEGDVFKCYTNNYSAGSALDTSNGIEKNLVACIPETDYFVREY